MFAQDYRLHFPDEQIYISRNHQWAFAAWELGRQAGVLKENALLLHVDAHLDDTWDGVIVPGLQQMQTRQDVMAVAAQLAIDNFIWAGFAVRSIARIVYVCPTDMDDSDPFDLADWPLAGEQLKPIRELIQERAYTGERYETLAEFRLRGGETELMARGNEEDGPSIILDLDLDLFKLNLTDLSDQRLWPEAQIKAELQYLKQLYPYDMVTVALSPAFCGGDENCAYLYRLFLDVFGLDEAQGKVW